MVKAPLLEWWARAKIGGGVLGWRGRREARGERTLHVEAMRRKAQLRKEAEAALRAVMAAEQRLLDLAALEAKLAHARGAGAAGALLSEAQELLDTVDALRHTCAAALRVAMQGVRCECAAAAGAGGAALTPTSSRPSTPKWGRCPQVVVGSVAPAAARAAAAGCGQCGMSNAPHAKFCRECGVKVLLSQPAETEAPEPEAEAARGNAVGIEMEALRAAVDAAREAGIDTELLVAGAALLASEEARQAQKAAEMRERLEEAVHAAAARTRAAATIQSPARGRAARQRYGEIRAAAARQLTAVARIQAAARGGARRRPYSAMRAAALLLQAGARRHAVRMLVNELLLDLRLLRNGHVFIKFSQDNGRPHDRLVQLQAEL